eukprot:6362292-Pyramimonas_sp.AAC.1
MLETGLRVGTRSASSSRTRSRKQISSTCALSVGIGRAIRDLMRTPEITTPWALGALAGQAGTGVTLEAPMTAGTQSGTWAKTVFGGSAMSAGDKRTTARGVKVLTQ